MEIDIPSIFFLTNHTFIRNPSVDSFVAENNMDIFLSQFVVYSVGLIDSERIVHALRFLKQCQSPGVTSYLIEWYNVATFSKNELLYQPPNKFDSVTFWVHSGVALRKNFFLFQDRMSLYKSTFLYDKKREQYFRLVHLLPFLKLEQEVSICYPMYSDVNKIFLNNHRKKKNKKIQPDYNQLSLKKNLQKILKVNNSFSYIQKRHPRLFEEIIKITN
jgi:hypothetical protein